MVPNNRKSINVIVVVIVTLMMIATIDAGQLHGLQASAAQINDQYRDAFLGQIKQFATIIQDTVIMQQTTSNYNTIGQRCRQDIIYLTNNALNNVTWALKVFDSMGKPSSGLMEASMTFLGQYSECVELESPKFNGQYCLVNIQLSRMSLSTFGSLSGLSSNILKDTQPKIGICAPSTCKREEISILANEVISRILFDSNATVSTCYKQTHELVQLHFGAKIAIAVFATIIILVISATTIDLSTSPASSASLSSFSSSLDCGGSSSSSQSTLLESSSYYYDTTPSPAATPVAAVSAWDRQQDNNNYTTIIGTISNHSLSVSPHQHHSTTAKSAANYCQDSCCLRAATQHFKNNIMMRSTNILSMPCKKVTTPTVVLSAYIPANDHHHHHHEQQQQQQQNSKTEMDTCVLSSQAPLTTSKIAQAAAAGCLCDSCQATMNLMTSATCHDANKLMPPSSTIDESTTTDHQHYHQHHHTNNYTVTADHHHQQQQLQHHHDRVMTDSHLLGGFVETELRGQRSCSLSSSSSSMMSSSSTTPLRLSHHDDRGGSSRRRARTFISDDQTTNQQIKHQTMRADNLLDSKSTPYKILMSFSIRRNANKIFDTAVDSKQPVGTQNRPIVMDSSSSSSSVEAHSHNQQHQHQQRHLSTTMSANNGGGGVNLAVPTISSHHQYQLSPWQQQQQQQQQTLAPPTDGPITCIASLHGLRFISMIWIIIVHSYNFGLQWLSFTNPQLVQNIYKTAASQLVANGTFACDSFLFVSGFLVYFSSLDVTSSSTTTTNTSHNRYQSTTTNQSMHNRSRTFSSMNLLHGVKLSLTRVFHRYIRMMPLMMAIIGFGATLLRYMGEGPSWNDSTVMFDSWCRKNWWVNMLFLHNFVNRENMCLSHSWYSAVDMQLFLLAQIIMFVLVRKCKLGLFIMGVCLAASLIIPAALTIVHHLPAVPLLEAVSGETMNLYFGKLYIMPYCRAAPYLIGMLLAFMLHNRIVFNLSKRAIVLGWTMSITGYVAIVLAMQPAMNGKIPNDYLSALYSSLSRPLWGLCNAWTIYACVTGNGGIFNTILSAKIWIPFSRLTYPAFLIHPIVMAVFYGSRQTAFDFSHYFMFYLILGNIVITYALSFILSMLIELPLLSIEKVLRKRQTPNLSPAAQPSSSSSPPPPPPPPPQSSSSECDRQHKQRLQQQKQKQHHQHHQHHHHQQTATASSCAKGNFDQYGKAACKLAANFFFKRTKA